MGVTPPPPVSCPPPPPPPPPAPAPANAVKGSVWVSGSTLQCVASDGTIVGMTGQSVRTAPEARPGSMWINTDSLFYVDASNVVRSAFRTSLAAKPAIAIQGSVWLQSSQPAANQFAWVGSTALFRWT